MESNEHVSEFEYEAIEAAADVAGAHPVTTLLLVALGGCIGASLRYLIEAWITRHTGDAFPWGTMIVNVSGAFLLGMITALVVTRSIAPNYLRPALGIGVLGAYTTFSTLAMDALSLAHAGAAFRAVTYVVTTNIAGVAAAALGLFIGRRI